MINKIKYIILITFLLSLSHSYAVEKTKDKQVEVIGIDEIDYSDSPEIQSILDEKPPTNHRFSVGYNLIFSLHLGYGYRIFDKVYLGLGTNFFSKTYFSTSNFASEFTTLYFRMSYSLKDFNFNLNAGFIAFSSIMLASNYIFWSQGTYGNGLQISTDLMWGNKYIKIGFTVLYGMVRENVGKEVFREINGETFSYQDDFYVDKNIFSISLPFIRATIHF